MAATGVEEDADDQAAQLEEAGVVEGLVVAAGVDEVLCH